MREIKFRAWDKKKKMWTNYQIYLLDGSIRYMDKAIGTWHSDPNHERFVLTQFTGLKDKNGVEIYEGDIVEVVLPGNTEARNITIARGKVFYDEASFRVPAGDHISSWVRLDSLASNVEIRIIGNTFENPELLEEG